MIGRTMFVDLEKAAMFVIDVTEKAARFREPTGSHDRGGRLTLGTGVAGALDGCPA